MSGLTWDRMAEASRETEFSEANGNRKKNVCPCSAGHDQDRSPYSNDQYSAENPDYTYICRPPSNELFVKIPLVPPCKTLRSLWAHSHKNNLKQSGQ